LFISDKYLNMLFVGLTTNINYEHFRIFVYSFQFGIYKVTPNNYSRTPVTLVFTSYIGICRTVPFYTLAVKKEPIIASQKCVFLSHFFFFFKNCLQNLMGNAVIFWYFSKEGYLSNKTFTRFFVKSIVLCQLLQLWTDFDVIFIKKS